MLLYAEVAMVTPPLSKIQPPSGVLMWNNDYPSISCTAYPCRVVGEGAGARVGFTWTNDLTSSHSRVQALQNHQSILHTCVCTNWSHASTDRTCKLHAESANHCNTDTVNKVILQAWAALVATGIWWWGTCGNVTYQYLSHPAWHLHMSEQAGEKY